MNNYEIADQFSLLSKLMDIHGENSFKSKSYSNAAFNIERLPVALATMDDAELFAVKGIGEATGKKIRVLLNTGKLPQLEELIVNTPPGIIDMLQIKGLGPKKISVIWQELGIESLGELEYACNENRLVALKGFGAKTQESVLQNIVYFNQNLGFYLWAEAEAPARNLLAMLQSRYPDNRFSLTGDIRRQKETIEYIEIVTDLDGESVSNEFRNIEHALVDTTDPGICMVAIPGQPKLKIYIAAQQQYVCQLFLTTGSEVFTAAFTEKYALPETLADEAGIFAANGMAVVVPALRENAGILDKAVNHQMPALIQPGDIKGIIHSHSTWSDGVNTVSEMAEAAIRQGFEYLVLSDHSQSAFYAGGLKPEQVAAQHQEIDALNAKLAPFRIFKSIESDILGDGSLDYSDQVLATFDLVIASVHSNLKMSQEKAMDRVLTAVRNPHTRILGHPTGRLLLSRKGYPLDHKLLIDTCAEYQVVIEINAHPRRLDLDWQWIDYAMEKGVLLSIDPDAHAIEGYRDVYYGVMAAQKGGLTKACNLSSFSLAEFETFLKRRAVRK